MAEAVLKAPSKWDGGLAPFGARYGKLMMWFFLLSDAFTFGGLLISYGLIRFSNAYWPDPDIVFNGAPFIGDGFPLVFVGIMTFILIASSLTMVLAVEYGHESKQGKTALYMILTIIGGFMFLGCQAWEWTHLIVGEQSWVYDAETKKVEYKDIATTIKGNYWGPYVDKDGNRIENQMEAHKKVLAARQASGGGHAHGAETVQTPDVGVYRTKGPAVFGQFFFGITGFHGFHVSTGVLINILILIQILRGVYQRNGDYEMVEKVGLYWHFVDLVWVFVFTFFYLV